MTSPARTPPNRRIAVLVAVLALGIVGAGLTLAAPVWQCDTHQAPRGLAVVTRDCRPVPRSRALWTWLRTRAGL